jgi:hypothetical protein
LTRILVLTSSASKLQLDSQPLHLTGQAIERLSDSLARSLARSLHHLYRYPNGAVANYVQATGQWLASTGLISVYSLVPCSAPPPPIATPAEPTSEGTTNETPSANEAPVEAIPHPSTESPPPEDTPASPSPVVVAPTPDTPRVSGTITTCKCKPAFLFFLFPPTLVSNSPRERSKLSDALVSFLLLSSLICLQTSAPNEPTASLRCSPLSGTTTREPSAASEPHSSPSC